MQFAKQKQRGFTIVELLIVIVIIAILAAITIVAYNGIQNRANNTSVQADLKNTYNKLLQHQVINDVIPAHDSATLNGLLIASKDSYNTTTNAYLYCRSDQDMAVMGLSKAGGGYYYGTKGSGTVSSWNGANASLCPMAGIPTTATGYGYFWYKLAGSNWVW